MQKSPDYQTLVEHKVIDSTGRYIETFKKKSYKYKVKVVKEGLKVINKDGILIFNRISMESGKAVLPIMELVISNTNRDGTLSDQVSNKPFTTSELMFRLDLSRPTITKYFKKLIESGLVKRQKKNFVLSPYIFYPYVSDFNLLVLQEYWDSDFKKGKDKIASEIQIEVNKMVNEAQEFTGISKSEFEKIQNVKDIS